MNAPALWAARAGMAESAVRTRHLRRLWALPGTRLAVTDWPASLGRRLQLVWHYWWQAHLLDCLVDAQLRSPDYDRVREIKRLIGTIRLRNGLRWTNRYYDDCAWLALALWRAGEELGVHRTEAVDVLAARLRSGWTDHGGGGIWWRTKDDLKGVPSSGPAAILFTRLAAGGGDRADLQRALSTVDWIEEWLVDPDTGLVLDGMRVNPDGEVREVVDWVFTYNQGTFIGACAELAALTGSRVWAQVARRTVLAVCEHMTGKRGVLPGGGGGDGGLFPGIGARYLARAAVLLEDKDAAQVVYLSAEAAWRNRVSAPGGPLFCSEWTEPAVVGQERDLSVQLSAWMLFEAAAMLEREGVHPYSSS
ncbi:putative alpha-1,6-mannanase (GH76 family) [Kutzneria viridogrisea]|uniref:Alpha-1,6-mannanase (GH76 family) n=1 Tax=Kutzneria viridogrisea TaxID=47990 RepID=A0ABR6BSC7_9PSEU|nr:putative alpha-1,6-mannanase (GH76 family) [Kutzneria viridogrisea]